MIDNGKIPVLGEDNSDKIRRNRADEIFNKQERPLVEPANTPVYPPEGGIERYQKACEMLNESIEKAKRRLSRLLKDHTEDIWRIVGCDGNYEETRGERDVLAVGCERRYAGESAKVITDALNDEFAVACLELVTIVYPDEEFKG